MDKRKKQIVMRVVIILLLGMNLLLLIQSKDHKKFISDFIDLYYDQVLIKEEQRDKLLQDFENQKENDFYKEYEQYLTYNFMQNLIEAKKLPDFNLINYGIENHIKAFKIENARIRSKGKNVFDVKYDLILIDDKGKKTINHHEESYTLKKENKDYKINLITVKIRNLK